MNIEDLSPDDAVLLQWKFISLNYTIVYTWLVMVLLVGIAWLSTRKLSSGRNISRRQNFLEIIVGTINKQIQEVSQEDSARYLPFIGTLFLFIATSNLLAVVPGFHSPTASLSTTTALALCVLVAVPFYAISKQGVVGYLKQYLQPTPLMLPFNLIGELSRTLALAVRLFGNMMSGAKIAAILLAIAPLFFPILMNALGLLTGLIQAYIFAVLALVYIASASQAHHRPEANAQSETTESKNVS
ncbi:F0F1 ATP synthase subunit A [Bremerella sp.]|uniref:F0F1 ATP synthase subunit A n=1 Tax=Bremerella sp. TaxID=2795602 RepID=UPI00391C8F5F